MIDFNNLEEMNEDHKSLLNVAIKEIGDFEFGNARDIIDGINSTYAIKGEGSVVSAVLNSVIERINDDDKDGSIELLSKMIGYYMHDGKSITKSEFKSKGIFHMTAKSVDDEKRIIEGYASVAGIEDRDGETMMSTAFESGIKDYMANPILLYNHDDKKPIGSIIEMKMKPAGLWIKAQIAKGVAASDEAWSLIKQGVLKAFSVGGFFEKTKDNHINRWDLTEISVVSVPANQRALFSVVKAAKLGNDLIPTNIDDYILEFKDYGEKYGKVLSNNTMKLLEQAITALKVLLESGNPDDNTELQAKSLYEKTKKEVTTNMDNDLNELAGKVADQAIKAIDERNEAAKKVATEQVAHDEEIGKKAIEAYKEKMKSRGIPFEPPEDGDGKSETTITTKYDHMEFADVALLHQIMKSAKKVPSKQLLQAVAEKGIKIADKHGMSYAKKSMERGIKSDELMYSTQASYGDEWVPDLWASSLWEKIQLDAKVAGLFSSIEMPSQPYEYPLEMGNPTVYKVAEAADESSLVLTASTIPDSKVGTGKVTFNAGKIGAMTYFTEEMVEDSIIPILPQLRKQFADAMTRGVDDIILNGDETGSTGNISNEGGSIAATSKYLIADGLRHVALATTVTNKLDIGTFTVDDIGALLVLMGTGGKYGVDKSKLVIIMDSALYHKACLLDEFLTIDKMGSKATLLTGQVGAILGIPIVVSEEYQMTSTTGLINVTPASNSKGSLLIARTDGALIGWRRHVKMTVGDIPFSDSHYILATLRFDIQFADGEVVALGYNATV